MLSDGTQEFHNGVTVGLAEVVELFGRRVGMTFFAVGMPHYSLYFVACTAIVQPVFGSGVNQRQTPTPQWCGATPRVVYVIFHVELVLHEVGVWIYLLVWIFRERPVFYYVGCPVVVVTGCP